MDIEASAVARRAERPAEARMTGLRAEPEPRPLSVPSTSIVVNVVNVVPAVVGVGGGDRAEWEVGTIQVQVGHCLVDGFTRYGRAE